MTDTAFVHRYITVYKYGGAGYTDVANCLRDGWLVYSAHTRGNYTHFDLMRAV